MAKVKAEIKTDGALPVTSRFYARTTPPPKDNSNKYYRLKAKGGYNPCIQGGYNGGGRNTEGALPNCVGYAVGRWMEILNEKTATLQQSNARDMYELNKKRGLSCSETAPRLGAAVVWGGSTCGHIGVIEKVEVNGDIWVSDSNWCGDWFRYFKSTKKGGYKSYGGKPLIGFIYLPNSYDNATIKDLDSGITYKDNSATNGSTEITEKINSIFNGATISADSTTIYYNDGLEKSVNSLIKAREEDKKKKLTSTATDSKPTTPSGQEDSKSDIYEDIRKNDNIRDEDKKIMKGSYIEFSKTNVYASKTLTDSKVLLKDTYLSYIWTVDEVNGNNVLIGWNTRHSLRLNKWVDISACILVPSTVLNNTVLLTVRNDKGAKIYLNENFTSSNTPITTLPKNTIANIVQGSYKDNKYTVLLNEELRQKYSKMYGYCYANDFLEDEDRTV